MALWKTTEQNFYPLSMSHVKKLVLPELLGKFAAARRHRGLNRMHMKRNLFLKSNSGRDIELENTHIVLFTSPGVVLQVGRFSVQLGFGSSLVDWYKD